MIFIWLNFYVLVIVNFSSAGVINLIALGWFNLSLISFINNCFILRDAVYKNVVLISMIFVSLIFIELNFKDKINIEGTTKAYLCGVYLHDMQSFWSWSFYIEDQLNGDLKGCCLKQNNLS